MKRLYQQSTHQPSRTAGALFICTILICVVLNPLNSSTISVALPALLKAIHTNESGITWIVSAYYLGSAIAQPVMGKLGDTFGRSRFVYLGLFFMVLTAVMAPLSGSLTMFILWRIVQAVGTSMIYPNAIGLLRQYRSGDVGRILGWIGMATGVAVAVGPTLGGLLVDWLSWHAIFWLNIPMALIAAMLLRWSVPPRQEGIRNVGRERIDWAGMALFAGAVTSWLLWANGKRPLASSEMLMLAAALVLSVGLVLMERRHPAPILPVGWFRHPRFVLSSLITVLTNLAMYSILYGIPGILETVRGYSATKSGMMLLAFAGVMSLASPLGGRFAQGQKRRGPLVFAGALLFLGTFILCWISTLSITWVLMGLAMIGVSFSISNVVIQQIVLESAPKNEAGQASGVYTLLRYIGTIASSVLIGAYMNSATGATTLFVVLTIAGAITAALALGLRHRAASPNEL